MAGVVGWFMVLRRETFAGHTLSVMAFPGATGALLLGLSAAVGYFAFCGACALVIGAGRRRHAAAPRRGVRGHRHGAGVRARVRVPVPQPLPGRARRLREPAVRRLPRDHPRAGAHARDRLRRSRSAFFALVGRPLLFASVDEPVARASGVPVRALSLGVPARARAGRRGDRADHRRAARVRAARRAGRDRAADHPADRREPRR